MADPWRTYDSGGYEVLVGRDAAGNEELTLRHADPADGWLHVAGHAGSHVVIRNPGGGPIPKEVVMEAARIAAWFSEARGARGKVAVHWCRAADVSKRRGAPRGQVVLRRWEVVRVYPREPGLAAEEDGGL